MMLSGFWRDVGGVQALVSVNVLREPGGGGCYHSLRVPVLNQMGPTQNCLQLSGKSGTKQVLSRGKRSLWYCSLEAKL